MRSAQPEMIDAIYDVSGELVPADYHHALWEALSAHLPALASDALVGVIPLRTSTSEAGMLLPRRSKLVLRLTPALSENFEALSGKQLTIGSVSLQLGSGKLRKIQAYPTLHAHLVTGDADEVVFLEWVSARLTELGINGNLLCGMRNSMQLPDRTIQGYSLVIHDLKNEDSLLLQYAGLGADRRFGCGIFIPYKAITDLN
jgi:CRISPR-associated protein Cas6